MLLIKDILDSIVTSYHDILKDNLIGIYVHGSLAMNCFNAQTSDIDFLVVVKENIDFNIKRKLIDVLLNLSEVGPQKGFEMSVLLEKDLKHFTFPTPFVLHFSDAYKEKYKQDYSYMCDNGKDPDLAAHITVTVSRGICIFGKPINAVFEPVQRKFYIESIIYDIENAKEDILKSPMYVVLNLCRVLYYLKESVICSKKEGGEWACSNVNAPYDVVIKAALLAYKNTGILNYNNELLIDFADYMLEKINSLKSY